MSLTIGAVYVGRCYLGRWQVLIEGGLANSSMFVRLSVLADQYKWLGKGTH
jgi:hypothetical protein